MIEIQTTGLIHSTNLHQVKPTDFDLGEIIKISVEGYRSEHKKFDLKLISRKSVSDINYGLVLVNIAGFVLIGISIYMSKYLTQKGINKAIHEDSRKTTEIIESVRHSFQKDLEVVRKDLERGNELFKSQLQLINENQQSLNDEERNALVQFSSESEKQIHDLSNFDLPGLLTQSIEQNYAILNGIPRGLGGLFTSYTKVEIFVSDLNILSASSEQNIHLTRRPELTHSRSMSLNPEGHQDRNLGSN